MVKNEAKGPRPSKVRIEWPALRSTDGGSGGSKSSPILGPALPCLQKTPAGVGIAWFWRGLARGNKKQSFLMAGFGVKQKKTRHIYISMMI